MTVSIKAVETQLQKVKTYIDQLNEVLDERERLVKVLHLTPSKSDNLDVINLLARIKAGLDYAQEDLSSGISRELSGELIEVAKAYSDALSVLKDDAYVNVEEYSFQHLHKDDELAGKKSVRFKDYDSEDEVDDVTQMRNQLMGTSSNFKPYKDSAEDLEDENEDSERHTLSSIDTSNQEMFAQHQQQMLEQDQNLDSLHQSIRAQHRMGVNINDELDDHLILLNDLEQGVDGSHTRIRRATNGIAHFRRKVRENGSLATIVVLTVILILLLVVLN